MPRPFYALIAIAIATTFVATEPALSQGGTKVCRPGGRCVSTTASNYNRCVDLALRRGLLLTRGDRRDLNWFMYDCVAGRVRR
jgi:hypothetical protein